MRDQDQKNAPSLAEKSVLRSRVQGVKGLKGMLSDQYSWIALSVPFEIVGVG